MAGRPRLLARKPCRAILAICRTFSLSLCSSVSWASLTRRGELERRCARKRQRTLPRASVPFTRETTELTDLQELSKADEGTRTLDLLHGKCERPFVPVRSRSVN
jgi:hypothetical protein